MNSNLAQEETWIDAWSELYEIAKIHPNAEYQLPNEPVSFEDCLHWLQDSAYAGYSLKIETTTVRDYVKGQPGNRTIVLVHRHPPTT
jgi:type II secretory pathway component PulM